MHPSDRYHEAEVGPHGRQPAGSLRQRGRFGSRQGRQRRLAEGRSSEAASEAGAGHVRYQRSYLHQGHREAEGQLSVRRSSRPVQAGPQGRPRPACRLLSRTVS